MSDKESSRVPSPRQGHGALAQRGIEAAPGTDQLEARFGRLFPGLPARKDEPPHPADLGGLGGPMDGGTEHENSTSLFSVLTYFGQFLDHDITFDPTSSLERDQDPEAIRNFRTPMLDLDSVYGAGPAGSPFLYDQSNPDKMLLGSASNDPALVDLPRNSQGVALIGDPRNDENLIVSQLHVAFLKFHNALVDQLDTLPGAPSDQNRFAKAQRLVRWHYQWLVMHEFLPAIVGADTLGDVMSNGCKLYKPQAHPFLPVEFSVAAYRFGHSMVQPGYAINDRFGAALFPADRRQPPAARGDRRRDLRGGPLRLEERVNWKNFLDTGAPPSRALQATRFSSRINTRLARPLLSLPESHSASPQATMPASLAVRNLERSQRLGLPSGQAVAAFVSERCGQLRQLTEEELWDHPQTLQFKGCPAPLWYYFLREAEVVEAGERLGPIGARIVAEVIVGLLLADTRSSSATHACAPYLVQDPTWKPVVNGRKSPSDFTFADFFRIAGTDVH